MTEPAPVLAADVRPPTDGAARGRLVFVHGFTQTRRSWDDVRAEFGAFETVAVDAPGHGESAALALPMDEAAEALARAGGRATYVGYSMGARLALHLALARPDVVERLVLVSGTAGLADPGERAARVEADEALAASIEADGVDAFLRRWLALPLFAGLPTERAGLAERRANTAEGLAASLRLAGTGAQASLWDRLGELAVPVLLVVGAHDHKFVELGRRLRDAIAGADLVVVAGAGHTVHLEQPAAFVAALRGWLDRT